MTNLSTFNYLSNTVRVIEIDDQPWFVAADVCKALGLAHHEKNGYARHLTKLSPDQITNLSDVGVTHRWRGSSAAKLVSESGLYKLVMRSDKPEAQQFQDWVTREVLPSIRKNGGYILGQEKVATGEMTKLELAMAGYEALQAILREQVARAEQAEQRANAAERVIEEELNLVTVDEFRALLHKYWTHGFKVKLGQRAASLMRAEGVHPTQQIRLIHTKGRDVREVSVNVYPRKYLEQALSSMG